MSAIHVSFKRSVEADEEKQTRLLENILKQLCEIQEIELKKINQRVKQLDG